MKSWALASLAASAIISSREAFFCRKQCCHGNIKEIYILQDHGEEGAVGCQLIITDIPAVEINRTIGDINEQWELTSVVLPPPEVTMATLAPSGISNEIWSITRFSGVWPKSIWRSSICALARPIGLALSGISGLIEYVYGHGPRLLNSAEVLE